MAASAAVSGDASLVACCGLYCGTCGKCPGGCATYADADKWCGIRRCCRAHGFATCAECSVFPDVRACPTFHTLIGRCVGFVFGSDRPGSIDKIRELGLQGYADLMASNRTAAVRKTSWNPLDW